MDVDIAGGQQLRAGRTVIPDAVIVSAVSADLADIEAGSQQTTTTEAAVHLRQLLLHHI